MAGLYGSNTSLIFVSNDLKNVKTTEREQKYQVQLSFWLLGSLLTSKAINPEWVGLAVLVSRLSRNDN